MAARSIVRHLLADRAQFLDDDHFGAVDVDRIVIKLPLDLALAVLILADVHRELALLLGTGHKGVSSDGLTTPAQSLELGFLDELELELIAALPGLLTRANDWGFGPKTLVKDHKAGRCEALLQGAEYAPAGVVKVGEVCFNREVQVERGPRAQAVDEAQGVSPLEHNLFKELVVGKEGDNRTPSNLYKIHGTSNVVAVNIERSRGPFAMLDPYTLLRRATHSSVP